MLFGWIVLLAMGMIGASAAGQTTPAGPPPATVTVSGFGLLGNRELARLIRHTQGGTRPPPVVDSTFIEDGALILYSQIREEGYLDARVEITVVLTNGAPVTLEWDQTLETPMRQDLEAVRVNYRVRRGKRYYLDEVDITGLTVIPMRKAKPFFVGGETLVRTRVSRIYTPGRLEDALASLRESLVRLGYAQAQVTADPPDLDRDTGAVRVHVHVIEGLPTRVRSVKTRIYAPAGEAPLHEARVELDEPYSRLWQQGFIHSLQSTQYARGYPDPVITLDPAGSETNGLLIQLDLAARVDTGPRVRVGDVKLEGGEGVSRRVIESRISVEPGEWLNRLEAERGRQRLARLGVFDSVGLRYEQRDDTTRDVIYEMKKSKTQSLSVLAGYGSYEMLRGGLEFQEQNAFGLAHDFQARALQSFKSSEGDVRYTLPELFRGEVDLFFTGHGLRREEVSFDRLEYGGAAGVARFFRPIKLDASLRYDYQFLSARDIDAVPDSVIGVTEARAAAIVLNLSRDTRDNPLMPRRGFKLFLTAEEAADVLGGNVDYQRLTLGGSYHAPIGGGRILHLGLAHGISFTWGGTRDDLPFEKRFFPGGESTVRGYQEGEASPVDVNGNEIGAETYSLANVELEQLITESWSFVVFYDVVGIASDRRDYPWDEVLSSVGGGIRWRTIVGPVRLEYGYNLRRRTHDPVGTLHLSVGTPF